MQWSAFDPLLFLLAALPGLLICWYIYRTDKYEHESRVHIALAFALGALSTLPIIRIEAWLGTNLHHDWQPYWLKTIFESLLIAFSEEFIKLLPLLLIFYPRSFFNEPLDGIVYAVIIAMGFATTENILYALKYGLGTTILRAFTAVPAHGVFAIIMGYYAGLAKFRRQRQVPLLAKGLLLAFAAHSVYDVLLFQKIYEGLIVLAVVLVWLGIYFEQELIRRHQNNSPFKKGE